MEASSTGTGINSPHPSDPNPDDFFGGAEDDDGGAEAAAAADAAEAEAEGSSDTTDDAPEERQTVASPDPPPSGDASDGGEQASSGGKQKERPYVVLREIVLNREALDRLIQHAESGGNPLTVYAEVETVEARNDQHALRTVYGKRREQFGDEQRLVPVSKRAWKPRTVKPRKRVEEAIDIV